MNWKAEDDQRILTNLIEAETLAFYNRDFQSWSAIWLQAETSRRLGAVAGGQQADSGGQLEYYEGWNASASTVAGIMKQFHKPNPEAARAMRRDNFNFRITPTMAWVSFDQYCQDNGDPFDSIGLSHHVRIFEKTDAEWKLTFVGHDETNIGYASFPVMRVDRKASIFWMNEAARQNLPAHASLFVMAGQLRARNRQDDNNFHEALVKANSQSSIEPAQSTSQTQASPSGIPVALNSSTGEISDICWICRQDRMLMVSFSDSEAEKVRLATAANLYGLSPAQLRLAELIVSGQDVASGAKSMNISASTARTQLNRMFDKTSTRSQTALVRALLSVEAPSA